MRVRVVVFGSLGLVATLFAVVAVAAPDAVTSAETVLRTLDTSVLLGAGAATLALCGLAAAGLGGGEPTGGTAFDSAVGTPPETVVADDESLVAAATDATVEEAVAGDDDAMADLLDQLRATAATVYAVEADCDRSAARQAVSSGAWTGDTVAAAQLAPGTDQPLLARFRLWLDPESERERRVRRTVDAIERLAGGER